MKLIIVSGPWSSGTTAVAGILASLGYTGFGPYLQIIDQRFSNSFELIPFRDLVLRLASEQTLRLTVSSVDPIHDELTRFSQQVIEQQYGAYDPGRSPPLFLKYPLAALLLPWLAEHFELRQLLVGRPLAEIEATRVRRNWAPQYGAHGARELYPLLLTATLEKAIPTEVIHYAELLQRPEPAIRSIARFCGHDGTEEQARQALQFIEGSVAFRTAAEAASTSLPD